MIRRVFFDTNVLLDVLTDREPFVEAAAALWALAENRHLDGAMSAVSVPTIYYLIRRAAGHRKAVTAIRGMRAVFDIVPLDQTLIDQAIACEFPDFEDAVQSCAALRIDAQCIVTRDPKGFRKSEVRICTPEELLALIDAAR